MTTRKQAVARILPNGVRVPAGLTVNEMTFDEWWNKAQWDEQFGRYSREQIFQIALTAGFSADEISRGLGIGLARIAEETVPLTEAQQMQSVEIIRASVAEQRIAARERGFTGDICQDCGCFTMTRNGTCLKCETCGATTGCS